MLDTQRVTSISCKCLSINDLHTPPAGVVPSLFIWRDIFINYLHLFGIICAIWEIFKKIFNVYLTYICEKVVDYLNTLWYLLNMKIKVELPFGWRKLRAGTTIKDGDKYYSMPIKLWTQFLLLQTWAKATQTISYSIENGIVLMERPKISVTSDGKSQINPCLPA